MITEVGKYQDVRVAVGDPGRAEVSVGVQSQEKADVAARSLCRQNSPFLEEASLFVPIRASAAWRRPLHAGEGRLYSGS